MQKIGVMFVCLGNICRSPMAEAIFKAKVKDENLLIFFNISSSGTAGYHVNEAADQRTIQIANKYKLEFNHRAQQLNSQHFLDNDYLIAMDDDNLLNIKSKKPEDSRCEIYKMRHFDSEYLDSNVEDPYYGDLTDFEESYHVLDKSCEEFLQFVRIKHGI